MIDKTDTAVIDSSLELEGHGGAPEPSPGVNLYSYVELFRQLPVPCIETTLGGVIRRANDEAARLFNVSRSFLIAKPLLHFVARGDCQAFRTAIECIGGGRSLDRVTLRFRPRHGPPVARVKLSGRCLNKVSPRTIVWVVDPEM